MACTSTKLMIVLGCNIPHELDALKWKATGRRRVSFVFYLFYVVRQFVTKDTASY
jgi:hypothetical protein